MPGHIFAASLETQANIVNCYLRQGMHVWQCELWLNLDTAQRPVSRQCHAILLTIRQSAGKQSQDIADTVRGHQHAQ